MRRITESCSVFQRQVGSGNSCFCALEGRSMRPAFKDGDILLLKQVPPASLKTGNVIAFYSPCFRKIIVHRIIGFSKTGAERTFLTRGDSLDIVDEPVRAELIKGYVAARMHKGSFLSCRRYQEVLWLYASSLLRFLRRCKRWLLLNAASILFPMLPIRIRIQQKNRQVLRTAFLGRRKVGEKVSIGNQNRLWIHPLFAKTCLSDWMRK